jgi:hypothetical protein
MIRTHIRLQIQERSNDSRIYSNDTEWPLMGVCLARGLSTGKLHVNRHLDDVARSSRSSFQP